MLRGGHVAPVTPVWGAQRGLGKGWGGEIRSRSLSTFRPRRSGHRGQRWTHRGHAQPLGPPAPPPRPGRGWVTAAVSPRPGVPPQPDIVTKATVQLAVPPRPNAPPHHQQPPHPRSHSAPCLAWRWGCCRLFLAVPVPFRVPSLGSPPGHRAMPEGDTHSAESDATCWWHPATAGVCEYIFRFFKNIK